VKYNGPLQQRTGIRLRRSLIGSKDEPRSDEEENFVAHYLRTASDEELSVLDGLAELDRKYGPNLTPQK